MAKIIRWDRVKTLCH